MHMSSQVGISSKIFICYHQRTNSVVVYDQTGDLGSREVAEELRKKGWLMARRLQGGFAEWIEYGEEVQVPYQLVHIK